MDSQTALELLGLEHGYTADDLRKAYRSESKKWHPDVSTEPDAAEMFRAIGEAKEVLDKHLERRGRSTIPKANTEPFRYYEEPPVSRFTAPKGQAEDLASALFGDGPDLSGNFCVADMIGDRCDCERCQPLADFLATSFENLVLVCGCKVPNEPGLVAYSCGHGTTVELVTIQRATIRDVT